MEKEESTLQRLLLGKKIDGHASRQNYHMISDEATGTVMDGTARFLSNHQIEVTNNGEK